MITGGRNPFLNDGKRSLSLRHRRRIRAKGGAVYGKLDADDAYLVFGSRLNDDFLPLAVDSPGSRGLNRNGRLATQYASSERGNIARKDADTGEDKHQGKGPDECWRPEQTKAHAIS